MNKLKDNNRIDHLSAGLNGLAVITVNDPEFGFNPGAELWKGVEKRYSNNIHRFELSKKEALKGDCLARHGTVLIVDTTSNGTKFGTVSLIDLSLLNREDSWLQIPSIHGKLIARELSRLRNDGNLPERLLLIGVEGPAGSCYNASDTSRAVSKSESLNTASLTLSTLLETFSKRLPAKS